MRKSTKNEDPFFVSKRPKKWSRKTIFCPLCTKGTFLIIRKIKIWSLISYYISKSANNMPLNGQIHEICSQRWFQFDEKWDEPVLQWRKPRNRSIKLLSQTRSANHPCVDILSARYHCWLWINYIGTWYD